MSRLRSLPWFLAALLACSDSPLAVRRAFPADAEEVQPSESIPGILAAPGLLRSGGALIPLVWPPAVKLEGLVGAELLVQGWLDPSDGALLVTEFVVLAVDGLPALDGILLPAGELRGGFVIRTAAGVEADVPELPDALMDHAGHRVWLTLDGGRCVRYGVL